jgi:hypothetical protein
MEEERTTFIERVLISGMVAQSFRHHPAINLNHRKAIDGNGRAPRNVAQMRDESANHCQQILPVDKYLESFCGQDQNFDAGRAHLFQAGSCGGGLAGTSVSVPLEEQHPNATQCVSN